MASKQSSKKVDQPISQSNSSQLSLDDIDLFLTLSSSDQAVEALIPPFLSSTPQ
jgi:hypothetical protein